MMKQTNKLFVSLNVSQSQSNAEIRWILHFPARSWSTRTPAPPARAWRPPRPSPPSRERRNNRSITELNSLSAFLDNCILLSPSAWQWPLFCPPPVSKAVLCHILKSICMNSSFIKSQQKYIIQTCFNINITIHRSTCCSLASIARYGLASWCCFNPMQSVFVYA